MLVSGNINISCGQLAVNSQETRCPLDILFVHFNRLLIPPRHMLSGAQEEKATNAWEGTESQSFL